MKSLPENKNTGFHPQNEIESRTLAFVLTTYCNLKCSECATGIPRIVFPEHYGLEYIKHAASYFFGIEHVQITGGEPTMHPEFRQLVPHFKEMFGCRRLTLATNGYKVVDYADVLHYFDSIRISHYQHNQRDVEFITQNFSDICPQGPTLHVCISRRTRNPQPCADANRHIKYIYGELYPCCSIPGGLEGMGIPLTRNWQEEIVKVALPCADCLLAEEGEPPLQGTHVVSPSTISSTKPTQCPKERRRGWPHPPDDIAIYGLDVDCWMDQEAFIKLRSHGWSIRLRIVFESYAPQELHPISLTFQNDHGKDVHTHIVSKPGSSEARITVRRFLKRSEDVWLKLFCDKTFIPHHLDPNNPDTRELGIRIASLRYM